MSFNPYLNPAAPGYQMPYQPPMQDRIAQTQNNYQNALQQQQQALGQIPQTVQQPIQMQYTQVPQMIGRFVNEFTDITANDVPMDGRWAIFAKNDMSEIQARAWSSDGKIVPVVFKPVIIEQENNHPESKEEKLKIGLSDEATEAFMKRFDDISDQLEKMEKSMTSSMTKSSSSKAKKEVD